YVPTIKISGNPEKITTPGIKNVYRIVSRQTGRAEGDLITLVSEGTPDGNTIQLFNPTHTFIQKKVKDYEAVPLLKMIYKAGRQIYQIPQLVESRKRHAEGLSLFWPQYLRRLNPEIYPVDLSRQAWDMKMALIKEHMEE
ncbi:MAG: nicotinate phosphoribosyltransferase, partial [Gorillibacterium sp.]|nr:nicotinate phosphoribosyltransferase [Gorillibacterium sp.]